MNHEMEHTDDPSVAKEIAMDHLTEDVDYYKKIKKIEKSSFLNKLISVKPVDLVKSVSFDLIKSDLLDVGEIDALLSYSDDLAKGGPGSGQRGHTTAKPYPGVESHNMKLDDKQSTKSYVPPEGWGRTPHDPKDLLVYKLFNKVLSATNHDVSINDLADYDPKTQKMTFKHEDGKKIFDNMIARFRQQKESMNKKP